MNREQDQGERRADGGRLLLTVRPTAEVTIKAPRTRRAFMRKLRVAVKDALQRAGFQTHVRADANRVMAELTGWESESAARERAAEAASRIFGVSSYSFLEGASRANLDEIVAAGTELFAEKVRGRTYAVRCRRSGNHEFSSIDVERSLGAALNPGATVNLTNPEIMVEVEVTQQRARFYGERLKGAGGLPMGTGGRALALLSGGYDSVVAAWHLMRRGVEVDFVHFRLGDHPSEEVALGVAKLMTDSWSAGSRPEAHVIDLRGAVDEMREHVSANLWQVSLKRLMVRAADGVADALEERAGEEPPPSAPADERDPRQRGRRRARRQIDALVTGEAIGQVSSQTLSNLRTIDAAAMRPVLRPLIGFDKLEIMALAERIGTATLSATAIEECNITPGKPATASRAERLEREEAGMMGAALKVELERVRRGDSRLALRSLQPGEGRLASVEREPGDSPALSELPSGAVLLDCRATAMRRWRPAWPDVLSVGAGLPDAAGYGTDRVYVAFCPHGQRSDAVARHLRAAGVRAYTFEGGEGALKKHLSEAAVE